MSERRNRLVFSTCVFPHWPAGGSRSARNWRASAKESGSDARRKRQSWTQREMGWVSLAYFFSRVQGVVPKICIMTLHICTHGTQTRLLAVAVHCQSWLLIAWTCACQPGCDASMLVVSRSVVNRARFGSFIHQPVGKWRRPSHRKQQHGCFSTPRNTRNDKLEPPVTSVSHLNELRWFVSNWNFVDHRRHY